jgi:DNA polymerase III delta prime subunit
MSLREHFNWAEKYRPRTIADCILPARLKDTFQSFVDQEELPTLILHGPSGTGKTTAARALCDQIGVDTLIINASEDNGIDVLRTKIRSFASTVSFTDARKCVIMDEADYMSQHLQPAFRAFMDDFAQNCSFVFTCNYVNKIIPALHSRSTVVPFLFRKDEREPLMTAFFSRVRDILATEGVKCEPKVLANVINRYYPDFRRVLNALQTAVADGAVTMAVLGQSQEAAYKELWTSLVQRDFPMMRKWVGQNIDTDDTHAFRTVYEWLMDNAKSTCLPQMVITLNDYQHKSAFCPDKQLNMTACLVDVMSVLEMP